jgi:hypothetical protein
MNAIAPTTTATVAGTACSVAPASTAWKEHASTLLQLFERLGCAIDLLSQYVVDLGLRIRM